jgi:hypothetical protein
MTLRCDFEVLGAISEVAQHRESWRRLSEFTEWRARPFRHVFDGHEEIERGVRIRWSFAHTFEIMFEFPQQVICCLEPPGNLSCEPNIEPRLRLTHVETAAGLLMQWA